MLSNSLKNDAQKIVVAFRKLIRRIIKEGFPGWIERRPIKIITVVKIYPEDITGQIPVFLCSRVKL